MASLNQFTARILNEGDREAILDLCRRHARVSRENKVDDFDAKFEGDLARFLNPDNPHHQICGSFDGEGRLAAFISQVFWDREPLWMAVLFMTRGDGGFFNPEANGSAACMRLALSEGEKRQRFRFYILRNVNWPFQRYFKSLHRALPEYGRYARFVDLRITAGTQPASWWAWKMMGERTWPTDLYIEHLILKQTHRPSEYQIGVDTESANYAGLEGGLPSD